MGKIKLFPTAFSEVKIKWEVMSDNIHKGALYGIDADDGKEWLIGEAEVILNGEALKDSLEQKEREGTRTCRKLKGSKSTYLSKIVILEFVRSNGLGSLMLKEIAGYIKDNDLGDTIVCKAHPFVTYQYGIVKVQSNKWIRQNKQRVQSFYSKNGYEYLWKGKDFMFKRV